MPLDSTVIHCIDFVIIFFFLLHQIDITTAFLHGDLEEEVYMKQPEGFLVEGQEHLVCWLKKGIYGLKQALWCWNKALDAQLKIMGFSQFQ